MSDNDWCVFYNPSFCHPEKSSGNQTSTTHSHTHTQKITSPFWCIQLLTVIHINWIWVRVYQFFLLCQRNTFCFNVFEGKAKRLVCHVSAKIWKNFLISSGISWVLNFKWRNQWSGVRLVLWLRELVLKIYTRSWMLCGRILVWNNNNIMNIFQRRKFPTMIIGWKEVKWNN